MATFRSPSRQTRESHQYSVVPWPMLSGTAHSRARTGAATNNKPSRTSPATAHNLSGALSTLQITGYSNDFTCFAAMIFLAMRSQRDSGYTSLCLKATSGFDIICVTSSTTHHKLFRYSLEKFGKFFLMLEAGMHILVPFVDQITFTRCLKTGLLDCPPQVRATFKIQLWLNVSDCRQFLVFVPIWCIYNVFIFGLSAVLKRYTARHHKGQRVDCS
jgi:hypothetical protein